MVQYNDMDMWKCRKLIVKELEKFNLLEKIEDYKNSVGICYRCKTHIEPVISKQWFVRMDPLKKKACEAVNQNKIRFTPAFHTKIYNEWLKKMHDWCISRQIWWGHRIPVWYCDNCDKIYCEENDPTECAVCKGKLRRDTDVLDTWFSSALWAFSVFDDQERDYYFPTSVLVTGSDILFFWVTRMIIMTEELQDNVPFREVYLHGLVRDNKGIKMSKTLQNVIDPLDIIKEHNTDILRFTLASLTPQGRDVNLSNNSFKIGKTFCTKLWNSVRYMLMYIEDIDINIEKCQRPMDGWILNKLNKTIDRVKRCIDRYDFAEACQTLYRFT